MNMEETWLRDNQQIQNEVAALIRCEPFVALLIFGLFNQIMIEHDNFLKAPDAESRAESEKTIEILVTAASKNPNVVALLSILRHYDSRITPNLTSATAIDLWPVFKSAKVLSARN